MGGKGAAAFTLRYFSSPYSASLCLVLHPPRRQNLHNTATAAIDNTPPRDVPR